MYKICCPISIGLQDNILQSQTFRRSVKDVRSDMLGLLYHTKQVKSFICWCQYRCPFEPYLLRVMAICFVYDPLKYIQKTNDFCEADSRKIVNFRQLWFYLSHLYLLCIVVILSKMKDKVIGMIMV